MARARTRPQDARWTIRPSDDSVARSLESRLGIHPAIARTLAARGWRDADHCRGFLDPRLDSLRDPFELKDMDLAVERTLKALRKKERVWIFGDYDVDGVSSTAIVASALRFLGGDPRLHIPHRIHDGYGMNLEQVEMLAGEGAQLIITVDTGMSARVEVARAGELGVDVIVTDHHLLEGDPPAAVAIVNPNRSDASYPGGRLCGAGVAFKFAHALLKVAGTDPAEARAFLRSMMDLAALGTIADVVPLEGENRVLAAHGLEALARTQRIGLVALMEQAGVWGKPLSATTVAFALAPRLNAAGRTDHAMWALELLLTKDRARASEIAVYLDSLNRQRRRQENQILQECIRGAEGQMEAGEDAFLVVGGEDFHLGVVGIVAARLAERYYRPTVVLKLENDVARGSARSVPGFDVHEALGACSGHLESYGGHAAAAGVHIRRESIPSFRSEVNDYARRVCDERSLAPEIEIDALVEAGDISWDLYRDMRRLEPFGERNPTPTFLLKGVRSLRSPRIVGENHLKLCLDVDGAPMDAIGFRLGELLPICESTTRPFDLVFRPSENTWRGRTNLEMEILAARPHSTS